MILSADYACQQRGFTVEFKSPSNGDIPAACGPYSHAVIAGDYVFLAGQTGRDPRTGKVIEGDIEAQCGAAQLTHPTKLESRSWFNSFK